MSRISTLNQAQPVANNSLFVDVMGSQDNLDDVTPAFDLTDKDRENLASKDEDFQPHTWTNLKHIIGTVTLLSNMTSG